MIHVIHEFHVDASCRPYLGSGDKTKDAVMNWLGVRAL